MYKYYVIVSHDDNSIYMVVACTTKREAQRLALHFSDSAFVVTVVSGDCWKYSDSDIVKRAKRKGIDSYA